MRPARKGPENHQRRILASGSPRRFNEAGPQGAGKLRVAAQLGHRSSASMRPARKGPENTVEQKLVPRLRRRFNEAGPQGAGKPGDAGGGFLADILLQ